MKKLSTKELHKRLELEDLALFDVRGDVAYEEGHIPGAKTAPLGSLVFRVASIMNPDSHIAVYADEADASLAAEATERLENLGLKNVYCYAEGLEGWRDAGLPVIPSPHAKTQARGPVIECRQVIVDRHRAYGGAFENISAEVAGAGG
ncbi:MAG: rhodanese-like domain-containing protein [Myxococcota bacterium]|nr:rhodanese-like domain-containing protein [Myxococcota bacterium]